MKKSSSVTLTILAAVAALSTTACHRTEVRDCVDQNQRIVDDRYCDNQPAGRTYGSGGYYGGYYGYHWLFGGRSGGHVGDMVFGGSGSPTAGTHSVSDRSISRGGFGSGFSVGG